MITKALHKTVQRQKDAITVINSLFNSLKAYNYEYTPLLFDETLIVNEAQVPTGLLCEVKAGEYYITIFVIFLLYYQLYYNTIFL